MLLPKYMLQLTVSAEKAVEKNFTKNKNYDLKYFNVFIKQKRIFFISVCNFNFFFFCYLESKSHLFFLIHSCICVCMCLSFHVSVSVSLSVAVWSCARFTKIPIFSSSLLCSAYIILIFFDISTIGC